MSKVVVILINFVLKRYENNYPQVFLKKCKYIEKVKNRGLDKLLMT